MRRYSNRKGLCTRHPTEFHGKLERHAVAMDGFSEDGVLCIERYASYGE